MARSKPSMADDENAAAPAFDPTPVVDGADSWEWDTVQKGSPIGVTFEKFGDVFIGKYTGVEKIIPDKDDPFEILTFEDDRGKRYSISPSYKLQRAFYLVPEGSWCRITYVSNIDTGKAEPMKDYRVDVRRGTPVKTI